MPMSGAKAKLFTNVPFSMMSVAGLQAGSRAAKL